jgi:hypothetical protein
MFTLLSSNIGTILTALVLLGIVAAIVVKIVRDKKKSKCAGCPYACRSKACCG